VIDANTRRRVGVRVLRRHHCAVLARPRAQRDLTLTQTELSLGRSPRRRASVRASGAASISRRRSAPTTRDPLVTSSARAVVHLDGRRRSRRQRTGRSICTGDPRAFAVKVLGVLTLFTLREARRWVEAQTRVRTIQIRSAPPRRRTRSVILAGCRPAILGADRAGIATSRVVAMTPGLAVGHRLSGRRARTLVSIRHRGSRRRRPCCGLVLPSRRTARRRSDLQAVLCAIGTHDWGASSRQARLPLPVPWLCGSYT